MNIRPFFFLTPCLFFLNACSDHADEEKYASRPPVFEEIICEPLNTNETSIRAGQPFVVTARQKSLGKLLNNTTYT